MIATVTPYDTDTITVKVTQGGSFTAYRYSMIVEGETRGGIHPTPISSPRIMLGEGELSPVDNVAPAIPSNFDIVKNGDYIRLTWDEVTMGVGDSLAEINPSKNITYQVYRVTEPYAPFGSSPLGNSDTTFFVDDNIDGADVVGDVDQFYFWAIRAVDHDGNISGFTYRVGEIDYLLTDKWNPFGFPFEMTGITQASDLLGLIPDLDQLAYYIPGDAWTAWDKDIPAYNNFFVYPGYALWAYIPPPPLPYEFMLTLTGKLQDMEEYYYNLHKGRTPWNNIMVPLHITDLTTAEELCGDIATSTSAAKWNTTDDAWEQWIPALPWLNNFEVKPGGTYFIAVDEDLTWPEYGAPPRKAVPTNIDEQSSAGSEYPSPGLIWAEVGKNKTVEAKLYLESDQKSYLTIDSPGCGYQKGVIYFQLASLPTEWNVGDNAVVEVKVDGEEKVYQVKLTGKASYKLEGDGVNIPETFALHAPYPNPFNLSARIEYDLPEESDVELAVYNVLGEKVTTLHNGKVEAGSYSIVWNGRANGSDLASGVYFISLKAGEYKSVKSLILMK